MAPGVDLLAVARRTPGMTGADLANVLNEAALLTARSDMKLIDARALDEAIDRVVAGPQRRIADIERITARIALKSARPRDLILLRDTLGNLAGLHAVVVGRSNLVGKPIAQLLLRENCTVTMAHSKTKDLPALCRNADLLFAAIGRPDLLDDPRYTDNPDRVRHRDGHYLTVWDRARVQCDEAGNLVRPEPLVVEEPGQGKEGELRRHGVLPFTSASRRP